MRTKYSHTWRVRGGNGWRRKPRPFSTASQATPPTPPTHQVLLDDQICHVLAFLNNGTQACSFVYIRSVAAFALQSRSWVWLPEQKIFTEKDCPPPALTEPSLCSESTVYSIYPEVKNTQVFFLKKQEKCLLWCYNFLVFHGNQSTRQAVEPDFVVVAISVRRLTL